MTYNVEQLMFVRSSTKMFHLI